MATTATTTDQSADVFALLRELTQQQLTWSFESTSAPRRSCGAWPRATARRPAVFSKAWQVVGLGLFSLGFGISLQATGRQIVASAFLGLLVGLIVIGTFLAAIIMTVTALLAGRPRNRPPAYVLYLGAFYVLTPGSHGLRGFESWLGGHSILGFQGLGGIISLMIALAAGMLVGAAAVRSAAR